jgi:hypothetical protein
MNNLYKNDPVMRIYDEFEFGSCSNTIQEMYKNKQEVSEEIKRLKEEMKRPDIIEYYKDHPEEFSEIINEFNSLIDGKNKLIEDYDKEIERCRRIRNEIKTRTLKYILNQKETGQIGGGNTFSNCKDIENSTIKFRIDNNKVSTVNQSNNIYDYEFNNDYNEILEFINSEIVKLQKLEEERKQDENFNKYFRNIIGANRRYLLELALIREYILENSELEGGKNRKNKTRKKKSHKKKSLKSKRIKRLKK